MSNDQVVSLAQDILDAEMEWQLAMERSVKADEALVAAQNEADEAAEALADAAGVADEARRAMKTFLG